MTPIRSKGPKLNKFCEEPVIQNLAGNLALASEGWKGRSENRQCKKRVRNDPYESFLALFF